MTQFQKKYNLTEFERLADSIDAIKVNLGEQQRILNKHINFHQGVAKSNLIATRTY